MIRRAWSALNDADSWQELVCNFVAAAILACIVLAAAAFIALIIAVIVNAYRLDRACVEAGGISTRGLCLKPDALMPRGRP